MCSVFAQKHQQIGKICTEKKPFFVKRFILIVCNWNVQDFSYVVFVTCE